MSLDSGTRFDFPTLTHIKSIPQNWNIVRLKHVVADFVSGGTPESGNNEFWTDSEDGVAWAAIGDMTRSAYIEFTDKKITLKGVIDKNLTILPKGTLLYSMYASLGEVAELGIPAATNQAILGIYPAQKSINKNFLKYWLKSLKPGLRVLSSSNTQDNLNLEKVRNLPILLPPLSEQQAIVDYLDRETAQIDSLIAAKERLLELLAEKRRAIITHAVTRGLNGDVSLRDTGVEWLGVIPSHWEVKKLKYLIFGIETGFTPQSYNFPAQNGEWGVLKTGCVNGGVFNEQENKALPDDIDIPANLEVAVGDVLMSRASGSLDLIGSVALVNNKLNARLLLSDKTFRIKINHEVCDPQFFVNVMGAPLMRHQIRRAISGAEGLANNIAQTDIREFWLPVPPISEQKKIVEHVKSQTEKIDRLSELAQSTIENLHERRASLIAVVVSGQIEVK